MTTQSDYTIKLVRLLRKHFGMSQNELATKAGWSMHVVANLESRRKAGMTLEELVGCASALGVSPQCLLGSPTRKDRQWLGERTWDALAAEMEKV